jgi:hypothetical protein
MACSDLSRHHRAAGLRDPGREGLTAATIVKDLVHRIRPSPAPTPSLRRHRAVPGDMAESDWSPFGDPRTRRRTPRPSVIRCVFDAGYFGFQEDNGLHPLVDGCTLSSASGRGAPLQVRQPETGGPALGGQPAHLQPRFIDFATYWVQPVACRRKKPTSSPGGTQLLELISQLLPQAQLPRPGRPPRSSPADGHHRRQASLSAGRPRA